MNTANSDTAPNALRAALELQQRGEFAAAEQAYRELLSRFGPNPDAEHMLALTLHAAGRSEESLTWFERAEQARGGAMVWSNHAAALLAIGRAEQAATLARRAIRADGRHVGAWLNLGLAAEIEGNFAEAIDAFAETLALSPRNGTARRALARCHIATKNADAALATLRSIAEGTDAAADLIRAEALIEMDELDSAEKLLLRLADDENARAQALNLRAEIAADRGHGNDALDILREVLINEPENRRAIVKAALLRIARGESETGLRMLRAWLDRHPDDNAAAGSYLVACNYSERFDPTAMLAEHRSLRPAPLHAPSWPTGYTPSSEKPLRVGWVSTAFSVGPMEIFFADVLRAFPRVAPDVHNILYAIGGESTSAPASATWATNHRDVSKLSNAQIVAAIRADGVDVLVDMVGRAVGNRIAVFGARAAPVQIGWLDVFYPSGLDTMDYLVTDSWLSPHGADANFSERLLRLANGRLAYSPPPVAPADIESARIKRFISLNRFSKSNEGVIDVWASILRALPDWSLLLKAQGRDDDLAARFHALFAGADVDPSRVVIEGGGSYADAMESYGRASIALDPFPFSGCSTTCDALWMGLPVITWPRETIASRQTAAWLEMAGKPEWIAQDADSYVAIATRLAGDEAARLQWRKHARDTLRPSICNAERLARELGESIRAIARPRR